MKVESATSNRSETTFLKDGSEMAAEIQRKDWSATPLGPPELWPAVLKTATSIMLGARQPAAIWWGEEWITLHNDACRTAIGEPFKKALGEPAAEIWPEIWARLRPQLGQAAAAKGGESVPLTLSLGVAGISSAIAHRFTGSVLLSEGGETCGIFWSYAGLLPVDHESQNPTSSNDRLPHVLLAVGDANMREHIARVLNSTYQVTAVADGRAALSAMHRWKPDLVLSSTILPELDGIAVLRAVRQDSRLAHVPVIMLAAGGGEDAQVSAWDAGADECLIESFSARELLARVRAQLSISKLRSEALSREQALRIEAETLNALARELSSELDMQQLVQKVTDAGTQLSGAKFGAFFFNVVGEDGESYTLYTLSGADRTAFDKFGLPRNTPLFAPTFSGEAVVRCDDVQYDDRYGQNAPHQGMPVGHLPVRSYLAAPVRSRAGDVLGGLFFGHPEPGVFTAHTERVVTGLAAQAAVALDNARLYGQARAEIEERKRAETALRESERRYRQLVQGLPAAVYTTDGKGCIQLYNDAAVELWGQTPPGGQPRWCGAHKIFQTNGQPLPLDECPMAEAVRENRPIRGAEIIIERPDGSRRLALAHPTPMRDSAGKVVGGINMLLDITERKQADAELAATKDDLALQVKALTRLHDLAMRLAGTLALGPALEAILEALTEIHDADSGILFLYDSATDQLVSAASRGFNEVSMATFGRITTGANSGASGRAFTTKKRVIIEDVDADPLVYQYLDAAHASGVRAVHATPILTASMEVLGVLTVAFRETRKPTRRERQLANLCGRYAAETIEASRSRQALREMQERFSRFMQHLPGLAWIKDSEGRYMFANEAAERVFRTPRAKLYGKTDHEVFPPETARQFRENDQQALASEAGVETIETLEHSDGVHHSLVSKFPIPGADGMAPMIGGIAIDVTERANAELALSESELRFRSLTMNAPVAIYTKDLDGRYTLCNPLAAQALGRPDGAIGLADSDLIDAEAADRLRKHDLEVMAEGRAIEYEERVGRAGRQRDFLSVKFPLVDADGKTVGVCGVSVDITDRKRAQQALLESEQRLGLATSAGKLGVWDWDIVADRVSWSESLYAIHGVGPEWFTETVGGFSGLVHPEDRDRVATAIQDALHTDAPYELEFRALQPTGEVIWLFTNAVVMRENGQPVRMLGATMDITESKRGEAALRESEARFRTLASHAPVGIFQSDADGRTLFVNDNWCAMTGLSPEQARGEGWEKALHPDDRQRVLSGWNEAVRNGLASNVEFRFMRPDGIVTWLQGNAVPLPGADGTPAGFIGTVADITERKKAEEALRNSERMYRAIGESIDYGVWVCDAEGRHIYASESFLNLIGMTQEECQAMGWTQALHPDDVDQTIAAWRECVRTGEMWDVEHRFRSASGTWQPILARGVPVRDDRGEIIAWVGINLDISQLKKVEDELRESEARFRSMADNSPVLIWMNGLYGCQYVNKQYLKFCGATHEEVLGAGWTRFVHPDDVGSYLAMYEEAFKKRAPFESLVRLRRADGEYRWLTSTGAPRFGANGAFLGYVGCSVDFTDMKSSEESLREADRRKDEFLAMLGHELRNPLAGIVTGGQVLSMLDLGDEAREMQAVIARQASYMSQIVDDLLDVSRIARGKLSLRHQHVNLSQLLREVCDDYKRGRLLGECNLLCKTPAEQVWVWGDATRLTQTFSNVIHNSQKFGDGPNEIAVTMRLSDSGRRAEVVINDRGIGMTSETLGRIFEAFNQADTSLERSRGGLGLGLALTRGLVELHGGTVRAESEGLGKGSTITITLPTVAAPEEVSEEMIEETVEPTRVLIIDDRRDAMTPLCKILQKDGHTVATALDGPSGLAQAAEFQPQVVLCDIGLDGDMNGYEVSRALRQLPATADSYLVAVTGYGQEDDRRKAKEAGFDYHVTKPLGKQQVKTLLGRRPRF
jgi:PAS domain S-box-containing protein